MWRGLWHVQEESIKRYRCHVGHSYTEKDLLLKQAETLEATLWVALRMMEERSNLLTKMAKDEKTKGLNTLASHKEQRKAELQVHITKLKEVLFERYTDEAPTKYQKT